MFGWSKKGKNEKYMKENEWGNVIFCCLVGVKKEKIKQDG